ncbi:hypothetical protein ACFQH2_12535 [Natronoarchaeum sp. GCM10025703]|uniref:DUF7261 family protein n=1 Tax=unclassified Natronoarchaeum TaxID=2620183 RepID=UPI00361B06D4
MTGTTRDDRGQLILVGAVALSLVLIGIVVVFSTTLFTANMAASSTNAGISDGSAVESDVNRTVASLAQRANNDSANGNYSERTTAFHNSIKEYDRLIAERYGDSGPTIVSIPPDEVSTTKSSDKIDTVQVTVIYETRSVTKERTIEVTV